MRRCLVCHYETDMDDVVVANGRGSCICVRCYARETGHTLVMPRALRRDVEAAMAVAG